MNESITYMTGGESHGPAMTCMIKGLPAGFQINIEQLNYQLWRRQQGYGRGDRMKIEQDKVAVLSGLRNSMTLASPVTLMVQNKDFKNWQYKMDPVESDVSEKVRIPRPGHADYPGITKYGFDDIRNVLERASARETAARILPGAVCRQFLEELGINIYSHIIQLGAIKISRSNISETLLKKADTSDMRCIDEQKAEAMRKEIDKVKAAGDSIGGIFQIVIYDLPVGLGSYVHWDDKLSVALASEIMGLQAIKGVSFGDGFEAADKTGSQYHDAFKIKGNEVLRTSNHAGGLEGGMSNGNPLVINAVMKPIPTLTRALESFDIGNMEKVDAHKERSDTCALSAATVVAENLVARPILNAILSRYGADRWDEIKKRFLEV
ncbi:MAG: chorismate synthase [Candidatus Neomarinimicrobiota bacterium]|nr:MAG: chorismate synthase [Candidatus Neomarinimicrobiota bacterium]